MHSDLLCIKVTLVPCWKAQVEGEKGESRETAGPRVRDDSCLVVRTDRSDGPLRYSADGNDSTIIQAKMRKWDNAEC